MTFPHAYYRTSIKALVLDEEGKFLLAQEARGVWELLGGALDHGEAPREGLKREIGEETGFEVLDIVEKPAYFVTAYDDLFDIWKANVLYKTTLKDLNFKPSDECVALRFFSPEETEEVEVLSNVAAFIKAFKQHPVS